jgi:dihydrofolate reductase
MISFIVAMDKNGAIGNKNNLPWHLPEDLKFFKRVTLGHPIAMGRKTHESIGRPLPGRKNIIITRNPDFQSEGCTVFYSVPDFVAYCGQMEEEVFVIGGAEIFKEIFPFANRLYITQIHHEFVADTFFPEFEKSKWEQKSCTKGLKDEKNPYNYDFCLYERKD